MSFKIRFKNLWPAKLPQIAFEKSLLGKRKGSPPPLYPALESPVTIPWQPYQPYQYMMWCIVVVISEWQKREREQAMQWQSLRGPLSDAFLMQHTTKDPAKCSICNEEPPVSEWFQCRDCGPGVYYCGNCCAQMHKVLRLHVPEIWKVTCVMFWMVSSV